MSLRKKFLSISSPGIVANIISQVVAIANIALLNKWLEAADLGKYFLVTNIYFLIIILSSLQSWQYYIQFNENNDKKTLAKSISLDQVSSIFQGSVLLLLLPFLSFNLQLSTVLLLAFSAFLSGFSTIEGYLRFNSRFISFSIISLVAPVVRLVFLYISILLSAKGDIDLALKIFSIGEILNGFCLISIFPMNKLIFSPTTLGSLLRLNLNEIKFIFKCWLNSLIDIPATYLDKIIIFKFLGGELSAAFNVLSKIAQSISQLLNPIFRAIYPYMVNVNRGDVAMIKKLNIFHPSILIGVLSFSVVVIFFVNIFFEVFILKIFPIIAGLKVELSVMFFLQSFSIYLTIFRINIWAKGVPGKAIVLSLLFSLSYLASLFLLFINQSITFASTLLGIPMLISIAYVFYAGRKIF